MCICVSDSMSKTVYTNTYWWLLVVKSSSQEPEPQLLSRHGKYCRVLWTQKPHLRRKERRESLCNVDFPFYQLG